MDLRIGSRAVRLIFHEDPDEQQISWKLRIFRNLLMWWAMFVALFGVGVVTLIILWPPLSAIASGIADGGCRGDSPRNGVVDATGVRVLRIISDRGDLEINGRPGLSDVRVQGIACANSSERNKIDSITLDITREGDEIIVVVDIPSSTRTGRLDLSIDIPADLPSVEIEDELGPVIVNNIRDLRAIIGNGGLEARSISGDVIVPSLRGPATVQNIGGNVVLDQVRGRAGIDIRDVRGNVTIGLNRNGPAKIADIQGDVTVASAGFGDLDVERVAGDLVIMDNLRGDISHREIGGRVVLPGESEGDS